MSLTVSLIERETICSEEDRLNNDLHHLCCLIFLIMADKRAEPVVDGKPLSSLRVVDLKQELEKRGISKSGSKKDLVDRLRTVSMLFLPLLSY